MENSTANDASVTIIGTNQREAWLAGRVPSVEQVRPGIWSLPIVFPNNPLRYTLCHLIEDPEGPVLIDPGCLSDDSREALVAAVRAAGFELEQIGGAVVTHAHFDHHGLSAAVVAAAPRAWIGMHPDERSMLPSRFNHDDDGIGRDWMTARGIPDAEHLNSLMSQRSRSLVRQMPDPTVLVEDGDLLPLADRKIRAVWTPGHTPGHLCFHDEDNQLFFSGDHVLPRITPNIGVQSPDAPPPLGRYLTSLAATARYDDCEVLPGHEWRFRGLAARVGELIEHHRHRCAEIVDAVTSAPGATAWTISSHITWSRGWDALSGMLRRMAISETLAHLQYLEQEGQIRESDEDGVIRYRPVSSAGV